MDIGMTAPLPDNALTEDVELVANVANALYRATFGDARGWNYADPPENWLRQARAALTVVQSRVASIKAAARAEVEELRAEVERQRKRADAEAQLRQMGKLTRSEDRLNKLRDERDAARKDADELRGALERVDWWHHAGVWNSNCHGSPTRLHLTPPRQLEAKCSECGFAVVGMDSDGNAIRAAALAGGDSDAV